MSHTHLNQRWSIIHTIRLSSSSVGAVVCAKGSTGTIVCEHSNPHPQTRPLPLKCQAIPQLGYHGRDQGHVNSLCLMTVTADDHLFCGCGEMSSEVITKTLAVCCRSDGRSRLCSSGVTARTGSGLSKAIHSVDGWPVQEREASVDVDVESKQKPRGSAYRQVGAQVVRLLYYLNHARYMSPLAASSFKACVCWVFDMNNLISALSRSNSFLNSGANHSLQPAALPLLDPKHARQEIIAL